jgi:Zn-dependent peptidase ImmA (M78 family)
MQYRHPGQAFLAEHGLLQTEQDVYRYVEFLRQQAGLTDEPPIDLTQIYQAFGIPTPLRAPLADQQGILVDSDAGLILIKEDDPLVRQRFTEGHELMELLFDAQERLLQGTNTPLPWQAEQKEQLCDRGAAELLMPTSSFLPQLRSLGFSLRTGQTLANLYQTSLLATLLRMVQHESGAYAVVMWHRALSRREAKGCLPTKPQPKKKLRVWWRAKAQGWSSGFIPKNKSIPHDSLIAVAFHSGQPQTGTETLDFGSGPIHCYVEALPMQLGEKACVLSLLHLPSLVPSLN